MQATELILLNTPQTIYSLTNVEFNKKDVVVISSSGTMDLAVIKGKVPLVNNEI